MKRILITVCTYNERENIRPLISELRAAVPDADILVIDDNSPDGTGDIVREFAAVDDHVKLLHREKKEGLGTAVLAGFRYAIDHNYDLLVNMDADFSHPPASIPQLIQNADRADVVIGSRYVAGGAIRGWGLKRHLMSRLINLYARLLLGLTTKDNSGSFRCYSVARLAAIDWDNTVSTGYAFLEEVLFKCRQSGCSFAEVPITFEDRRRGETKINGKEAIKAVWVILRLGVSRIFRANRRKTHQ